jgi:hypothetical protein
MYYTPSAAGVPPLAFAKKQIISQGIVLLGLFLPEEHNYT